MIKISNDKKSFEAIKILLPDICPDVRFELETVDENLEKLGLCQSAPCVVALALDEHGFDNLLEILSDIEINAFNTAKGEQLKTDNPDYQKYLKYRYLYDIIFNAEMTTAE